MSVKTKQQLKETFVDGHLVTGDDFTDLIDSLKGVQAGLSPGPASGVGTEFIYNLSQNEEGVITASRRSVDFSGYQTVAGMASYQSNDAQMTGSYSADSSRIIVHNKGHYPTVRLLDALGEMVYPSAATYRVIHSNVNELTITPNAGFTGTYTFVLD